MKDFDMLFVFILFPVRKNEAKVFAALIVIQAATHSSYTSALRF